LIESITQAFFLDRLLDLNNQTQMTAFETSVRNRMRGEALGAMFMRQIMEVLTPTIERTFNILWRRGQLGHIQEGPGSRLRAKWAEILGGTNEIVVPDAVIKAAAAGLDIYEIEYISPAKRFMMSEKLQGLFTASDAIVALSQAIPGMTDNLDSDRMAELVFKLTGAPAEGLRTRDEVRDLRAGAAQQQRAVSALETAKGVSEVTRNVAQARATLGAAGGRMGAMG